MSDAAATYTFLSSLQPATNAPSHASGAAAPRGEFSVQLRVNAGQVSVPLRRLGPGDVTRLDRRQVVRTEPPHLSSSFEPNYFPAVEFDREDLPWLFSPGPIAGRLWPWICLIALRKDSVELDLRAEPLPVLTIEDAGAELPDLDYCWAWAHAQLAGRVAVPNGACFEDAAWGPKADSTMLGAEPNGSAPATPSARPPATSEALDGVLKQPERTLSRLLCPRELESGKSYYACVVPTFRVGTLAGLGQEPTGGLEPAWSLGAESPAAVELPVYYHWEFSTAPEGDFEALVLRLQGRPAPAEVGRCDVDVSRPAAGFVAAAAGGVLGLEGALRRPSATPRPEDSEDQDDAGGPVQPDEEIAQGGGAGEAQVRPNGVSPEFQSQLEEVLNAQAERSKGYEGVEARERLVAPPIHGQWHAGRERLDSNATPPWLRQLNLDPRHRAAAGFGAQVVQDQQEQLMASAWAQVEDIERANQQLRQAQLAKAVATSLYERRLKRLPAPDLLQLAAPVHARVVMTGATVQREIELRRPPAAAFSMPLRRLLRPRGPIARALPSRDLAGQITARLNAAVAPSGLPVPTGMVSVRDYADKLSTTPLSQVLKSPEFRDASVPAPRVALSPGVDPSQPGPSAAGADGPPLERFRDALAEALEADQPVPGTLGVGQVAAAVLAGLDPSDTVPARVRARLELGDQVSKPGKELDQVMAAPSFPLPMYEPLRDISQDLIIPGVEHLPLDSVTALETNPAFVEAYMVGLNHEMSRELLWRQFPSDQRGTYFRQFWDARVASSRTPDIEPIHAWRQSLGENLTAESAQVVLVIRGELLRRYPLTRVYAVEAAGPRQLGSNSQQPVFRGALAPDITFVGFQGLTVAQALADPGWFFVIEEHPTAPRFGLNAPTENGSATPPPSTWQQIGWDHVKPSAAGYLGPEDAVLKGIGGQGWNPEAAGMAAITLQDPVRVAIHASALLAADCPTPPTWKATAAPPGGES